MFAAVVGSIAMGRGVVTSSGTQRNDALHDAMANDDFNFVISKVS